ncbi:Alpha/Beta hydrolase protein [Halteromyces radiatus]|uniref:Alpha/Beta hydrolase protein n=1 Tax=Halteromyces radiatus TaxID=101107 RepID=UPI00222098B9|nr:Alpha/Beta hydrolase protein [Halteromyces radiatus]KAI8099964.1 Alpha/Beta hydrolase protein [Halteromyces radiatus]
MKTSTNQDIIPFTVPGLTDEQKEQLQEKLANIVYPNELESDVGWDYGAPTWAVKSMADIWRQEYDFDTARQEINQWHHYHTKIEDLNIHFIHEPSSHPDALPILLCHGWPSTFYEFHKVINALRDGENGKQAFHVVVPSLPGYGFSDPPKTPGCGVVKMSDMLNTLMIKLGYSKYLFSGTDYGAIIGKYTATNHSENCCGFHTNFPMVLPPIPTPRNLLFHPLNVFKFFGSLVTGFNWMYGQGKTILNWATFANAELYYGCGYRAIQGTRPYTLSYGLSDSPLGLMAWMLEKYHEWTFHEDESISKKVSLPPTITADEFLTQVTLYWMTNTMSSSIRIYYECLHQHEMFKTVIPRINVPTAISNFNHDVIKLPKEWLETSTNLQHYKEYTKGGHFPGLEVDKLLIKDIQDFGGKLNRQHKRIFAKL